MCCEETSLVVNKTEGEMFTGSPVDKTERTRRYISICVLWGNVSLCVVRFCPVCVCCFLFAASRASRPPRFKNNVCASVRNVMQCFPLSRQLHRAYQRLTQ